MSLAILVAQSALIALADDFKTIDEKEYKNVTVSRVEPDGLVLKSKSGISKVYFTELPKEVQERFHYNPSEAAEFGNAAQAAADESNAVAAAAAAQQQQKQEEARKLAQRQKYRIQGFVLRKTNDGLIVDLSNEGATSHNATDVPMGIKNPIGDLEWRGFKLVFLRGHPAQENLADGDLVDAVAYDSGTASLGGSTYRCYTLFEMTFSKPEV
jgi:hypothetical protein